MESSRSAKFCNEVMCLSLSMMFVERLKLHFQKNA